MMIRDQRHMSGDRYRESPEAVISYWHGFAAENLKKHGFRFATRRDGTDFRTSRRQLRAYLNHSRWVADCPMDDCNGGIALWHLHEKACCLDCGTIFTNIAWPKPEDIEAVESIARLVPQEEMRNWPTDRYDAKQAIERLREVALT